MKGVENKRNVESKQQTRDYHLPVTKFKALEKSLELMIFSLINVHENDLKILGDLMGGTTKWQQISSNEDEKDEGKHDEDDVLEENGVNSSKEEEDELEQEEQVVKSPCHVK